MELQEVTVEDVPAMERGVVLSGNNRVVEDIVRELVGGVAI